MPVRSSLCTYSPMAASSGGGAMPGRGSSSLGGSSSKYSAILPTSSPLSYGHYKPLTSSSAGYSPSSPSATSSSTLGRYNRLASSSSYSPTSYLPPSPSSSISSSSTTASSSSTSSNGLYRPLSSMRASTSGRFSASGSPRYSSSSASTGSLTSTGSSGSEHLSAGGGSSLHYQAHKSLSSSAYSSGSSLSSTSSSTGYSSPYASTRRRLSTEQSPASPASSALPAEAPNGLMNLGNTCYMNASLQALYSLESFRNLLLSSEARRHSDRALSGELSELFAMMRDSSGPSRRSSQPTSPANFKFAFSRHQSKFSGFGQQDAQEFLRYLIDGIHEECNAASKRPRRCVSRSSPKSAQEAWLQYRDIVDDSPLVDLLVGQLCSTITCCECQHKSHCWDPFWDLSLPLLARGGGGGGSSAHSSARGSLSSWRSYYSSGSSSAHTSRLSDVIEEFTAPEVLDSDERPVCAHCKRPTRSTKQISLARLPRVLILHLKKFTNDGYKLSSPELQIDKQLTFNGASHYQLRACVSHHGHSSSSGHYTAHCEYAQRWLHFDDGRVRDVTSSFDCAKLDDAYVLFYTQQRSAGDGTGPASRRGSAAASISSSSTARHRDEQPSAISQSKL